MTRAEELAAQIVCEGERNTLEIQLSYARADAEALAEALAQVRSVIDDYDGFESWSGEAEFIQRLRALVGPVGERGMNEQT